jgi:hypothetical protein
LPLHGGRVPKWLGDRMTRLGAVIAKTIVHEFGRDELLRRLANPFWFQSLGAVMGMDWHSSGITTSVIGALKRGLTPLSGELGIHVCGGRGSHSHPTPHELVAIGDLVGLDGAVLAKASRLVTKVDSAAVQDGFDLYLHGFIVTDNGHWTVVQQGMNGDPRQARRYHWLSYNLGDRNGGRQRAGHPVQFGDLSSAVDAVGVDVADEPWPLTTQTNGDHPSGTRYCGPMDLVSHGLVAISFPPHPLSFFLYRVAEEGGR